MAPLSPADEEAIRKHEDDRFMKQYHPDEGTLMLEREEEESLHPAIPPERFRELLAVEIQWKDRDGHVWNVSDMADEHLANAMRMMLRNAASIYEREAVRELDWADQFGANMPDEAVIGLADMAAQPWKYIAKYYPPYRAMAAVRRKRKLGDLDALRRSREHHRDWLEDYERHGDETVKELVLFMMEPRGMMVEDEIESGIRQILGMPPNELPDVAEEKSHEQYMDEVYADITERDHQFGHGPF